MTYYNENHPHISKWLREVAKEGIVSPGVFDDRSICEVQPHEVREYQWAHFFAGIGGWDLALCLARWPAELPIWTGSCPCQPFSVAGHRRGQADSRHLWPEFYRLIRALHPPIVVGEQVPGAIGKGWLDEVFDGLETEGYSCWAVVLGAHSVGAPHRRQRLWWCGVRTADREWIAKRLEESRSRRETWRGVSKSGKGFVSYSIWSSGELERSGAGSSSSLNPMANASGSRRSKGWAKSGSGTTAVGGSGNATLAHRGEQRLARRKKQSARSERAAAERSSGGNDASNSATIETPKVGIRIETNGMSREEWFRIVTNFGQLPSPWISAPIQCRDGKHRLVPQSALLRMADGIQNRLDLVRPESGSPICQKGSVKNRRMLLSGYGNAIVPQVAAEFLKIILASLTE